MCGRLGDVVLGPLVDGIRRVATSAPDAPVGLRERAGAELGWHYVRMLFEAGHAISTFNSRGWIGLLDVPTAVVVTGLCFRSPVADGSGDRRRDCPSRRRRSCSVRAAAFLPPLGAAYLDVAERAARAPERRQSNRGSPDPPRTRALRLSTRRQECAKTKGTDVTDSRSRNGGHSAQAEWHRC